MANLTVNTKYLCVFGTVLDDDDYNTVGAKLVYVCHSNNPLITFDSLNQLIPTPLVIIDVFEDVSLETEEYIHSQLDGYRNKNKGKWYTPVVVTFISQYLEDIGKLNVINAFDKYRVYNVDNFDNDSKIDVFGTYYDMPNDPKLNPINGKPINWGIILE